jgi:hypothetical protein
MMMTLKALVNIGKHYLWLIKIQGYERISKYVDKEFLKIIIEIFSSINNCLCERKCVYTSNWLSLIRTWRKKRSYSTSLKTILQTDKIVF